VQLLWCLVFFFYLIIYDDGFSIEFDSLVAMMHKHNVDTDTWTLII